MKKALSAVLAVVLVLGVCFSVPMIASANNTDPFTYELDNAENPTGYIITGVKDGVTGPVEIPATYKPTGNINIFYPNNSEEPNVGSYEVTTTVSPSAEAGTAAVTDNEGEAVVTIDPADGYTLKSITVGGTPVAELPTADENGVYTYAFTPEADVTVAVAFTAEYTVTLTQPEVGGTISASPEKGVKGDEITLTAEAAPEYTFKEWIIVTGEGAEVEGNVLTIGTANVTVTAEFTKNTYNITFADGTTGVKAYDANGEVATAAPKGAVIEIKPDDSTKIVETVTVKDAEDNDIENLTVTGNKFTMPGEAVKVAATLVQGYAVNVAATENGTVTVNKTLAAEGDFITVTTTPAPGYKLGTLKVAYAGAEGEQTVTAEADGEHKGAYEMPAAAVTVTATFVKEEYTITLPTNVINGTIAIEGATEETKFYYGDKIDLTLTPAPGCQLGTLTYTYEGLETPVAIENGSFSMPAKNITINVTFVPKEMNVIGIKAGAFQGENAKNITSFTVAAGQTRFVAEDGVLFEKVVTPAQGETPETTTLKLIAFPANYTVAENAAKTYTIPASVTVEGPEEGVADDVTYAVTAVADGAFQALGNVQYVFCEDADVDIEESAQPAFGSTSEGENPTFTSNKKFHTTATHTEDDGEITTAATCQKAGVKTFKCEDCDAELRTEPVTDANAHKFIENDDDGFVVEIQATCQEKGLKIKACQNDGCNYSVSEYYTVGHTYATEFTVDVAATCEDGDVNTVNTGSKSKHCLTPGCDAKTEITTIPALTHEITDNGTNENITAKTEATCTEDGSITGNCDHCGKEVTLTLTKTGHKYIEVVDAEATCTVNGWQHEECEYCGDYLDGSDMELKAPGHVAATVKVDDDTTELKWTIVKAPTCSEDGFAEVRCANCGIQMVDPEGEIEYTRVLPATGKHDFGETWTVTKAATCEEEGEETGTCACGYTKTREIEALGHDIEGVDFTVDTEATCKDNGSKSKHCKRCDEKLEVTVITEKGPHKLKEGATETTKATCHNTGLYTGECTVCGDKAATVVIPALDHVWDDKAIDLKAPIQLVVDKVDEDGNVVLGTDGKPEKETITASAPTCTAAGYQAVYCKNEGCTAHKEDSVVKVDELGHNPVAYPSTVTPSTKVNATCTSEGTDYRYCDRCKAEYSIKIPMLQHDWKPEAEVLRETIKIQVEQLDETGKVVLGKDGKPVMVEADASAPTCEDPGYTAIYCKTCATYKDVTAVKALGHDALYKDWTLDTSKPATCTEKATETNKCSRCEAEMRQETGDFAACVFETEYTFEYPTCEEAGRKYYKCSNDDCDKISGEVVLEALGHKHATDAKWVGSDATCTEDGEKVKACTRMFYYDAETGKTLAEFTFPATDDEAGDDNSAAGGSTPATQAEGDTTGTEDDTETEVTLPAGVKYCDGAKQVTKATGHKFADTYTEDKEPTCLEAGKESRHCTNEDCTEKTGSRDIPALGHNYSTEYKTVTPATCQAEGKEARYCLNKDCEEYTGERKLAKTGHSYDDENGWVVDTRATCTEKGSKHNDCKVCGAAGRKTAEIAALGHDISNATLRTDPATCYKDGKKYKLCERYVQKANGIEMCGDEVVIEELKQLEHSWATAEEEAEIIKTTAKPADATTVEKAATCLTDGYAYKWCKNCEDWVGVDIDALGHKYDGEPTRVDPTCYSTGSLTGKCVNTYCDAEDKNAAVQVLPKLDHTFGEWEMRKDDSGDQLFDSCKTEDSMVRKCTAKGCTIGIEYGENENHTESGWILDSDATCSTNGKMHTECTVCKSEIKTQTLYATDAHEYEEDTTKRVEPTCIEPGSKTLVCKNCEGKKVEEIAATDHTFTDWKVFVEPTCTEKGIRQSVCTVCLTTKSEKILANGHTESDWIVTEPTCTTVGEKHKECTVCKEVIAGSSVELEALGHNYTTSNTCSAKDCGAQLYEYKLIGESKTDIEITKYNGSDKNVVIPSEIDGYIVKAIGDRAFMNIVVVKGAEAAETTPAGQDTTKCEKSTIETVTIPETVTTIGAYAFASASNNFKSVVIPGTVTTIGDYAFGYNATITWVEDEEAEVKEGETRPLIETISATTVNTENFTFAIYGVKDSAAAVYAAQDPEKDTDDFKFAAIADIYEVAIPEEFTEVAEKSSDNVVLFKDFVVYENNDPKKKDIVEQIKAVVDINVSGYSVEVVASQSYKADENATPVNFYGTGTKVLVKEGNNVVDVIEIAVQGDVNGDGISDAIDCMLIQLAAQKQKTLDGVYYTAGNITSDTAIDANDFSAAVDKIFGEDHMVGGKEEATTVPSTAAPTTQPTTEPTTQAPASTEPSTEGTSGESTPAESTPAESTPAATESQPASSEPAATTTTTQASATTTTTVAPSVAA